MTEEDIAAMRQDVEEQARILSGTYTIPADGMKKLMAEYGERCVEQVPTLLAEVERMREIVEAVAAADPVSDEAREWSGVPGWLSVAIDRVWVAKARAILNK